MKAVLSICLLLLTGCAGLTFTDRETECKERGYERDTLEHALCVERAR
ncbi:MAG: hypothetical protein AAFO63_08985 [Pseudomonadota bacterium]